MVKKTRATLANGLSLVVVEIPDSKSLVTSFWTKAGARLDPNDKAGMSHFIEHLVVKKTKKYPTDLELAQILDRVGSFKNAHTGKDWMYIDIPGSPKNLELTISVLSEMVLNPLFDEAGFESEKGVILQEQAKKRSLPDELVWEIWFKLFFNKTSMMNSVLGDEKSLANITLDDVKTFWEKQSKLLSNMIFISGGVNTDKAISLAQKYFGKHELEKGEDKIFKYEDGERILIEKRDLPRTNMIMSFRTPGGATYNDLYSLLALRGILALGWSSRITQRLRVKESLIYNIGSRMARYSDTGALMFLLASDRDNFAKMISILCEELVKVREKGITDEELELAKGYIEGITLSSIETSNDYIDWYGVDELYWPANVDSPEERVEKILKVTRRDVERVAKKYLTRDNWHLAVVGDAKVDKLKVDL